MSLAKNLTAGAGSKENFRVEGCQKFYSRFVKIFRSKLRIFQAGGIPWASQKSFMIIFMLDGILWRASPDIFWPRICVDKRYKQTSEASDERSRCELSG